MRRFPTGFDTGINSGIDVVKVNEEEVAQPRCAAVRPWLAIGIRPESVRGPGPPDSNASITAGQLE
jgi:hypothetical protein